MAGSRTYLGRPAPFPLLPGGWASGTGCSSVAALLVFAALWTTQAALDGSGGLGSC